ALGVAVPVAAVLLLFTVVGIPIAGIAMLFYLATLYPSLAFTAAWVGHGLLSLIPRPVPPAPDQWGVVLGVVVLVALFAAPYAGWAIHLLALFVGFGALWATVCGAVWPPAGAARARRQGVQQPRDVGGARSRAAQSAAERATA